MREAKQILIFSCVYINIYTWIYSYIWKYYCNCSYYWKWFYIVYVNMCFFTFITYDKAVILSPVKANVWILYLYIWISSCTIPGLGLVFSELLCGQVMNLKRKKKKTKSTWNIIFFHSSMHYSKESNDLFHLLNLLILLNSATDQLDFSILHKKGNNMCCWVYQCLFWTEI